MRNFLGVLMIVAGVALGFYVGLWVCFIGGIVEIVDNFPHDVGGVIWGALKFFLSSIAGYVSASVLVFPGVALMED